MRAWVVTLFAALAWGALGGCGESSECGTLERLCRDQCPPSVLQGCLELVAQGDERVCSASYAGYARNCPKGLWLD